MPKPRKTSCIDYCMHYLSRYPKTEKELSIKLLQKGYSEEEIQKTIVYLKEKNFLDDQQYAEAYINSEVIKKGKPLFKIKQKLFQKGVDKNIVDDVAKEYEDEAKNGMKDKINKEIEKLKAKGVDGFDIVQKLLAKGYHFKLVKEVAKERESKDMS